MKTHIYFLGILLLSTSTAFAQFSMLQDKGGQSSIILNKGTLIGVNAGNTSISASYLLNIDSNEKEKFIGINLTTKANNGVSALLQGEDFKPQFNLTAYAGKSVKVFSPSGYEYGYAGVQLTNSYFNLLNADSSYTFTSKSFFGYTLTLGYNILTGIGKAPVLIGTNINFGLLNNQNDLSAVQTSTMSTVISGNQSTTLQKSTKSGYSGDYYTTNTLMYNLDAYIFPTIGKKHQIGFGGYLRSQLTGVKPRNNLGLGFIVGQSKAPTNIVFGLFYQFNDVFNQLDKQSDFLKRGGVNIVAGYNF